MIILSAIFVLLLFLQIFIVVILLSGYHIVDPALFDRVRATGSVDALDVAAQLGRFDLVSMFLGIIALLIGVIAVSGFWMIRGAAMRAAEVAAKIEAKEQAEKVAERVARTYLEENTPKLVSSMVQSLKDTSLTLPPDIGLTPEEVQEVTAEAEEIGPNQDGHE